MTKRRKYKMNKQILAVYLKCRENGLSKKNSAEFCGLAEQTITNWHNHAKEVTERITQQMLDDEFFRPEDDPEYDFYYMYINERKGDAKIEMAALANLQDLARDEYFVDKDQVRRIDRKGSVEANKALLEIVNPDRYKKKEDNKASISANKIEFNFIPEKQLGNILDIQRQAQKQQQINLKDEED